MAKSDNRRAAGRRRAARQKARQARKAAKLEARLKTGRRARKFERQAGRRATKRARIAAKVEKTGIRQTGRTGRMQSKSEGGFFSPESTAARWGGIADVAGSATSLATGGLSSLGDALGDFDWQSILDQNGGESSSGERGLGAIPITEQEWFWPVAIGGGALVVYLATRDTKRRR